MTDQAPDPAPQDPRWLLSALADGEARADELEPVLAAWAAADPLAQQRWHAYHLIGDVLRSGDLASSPRREAAFLADLRSRLAAEPAPLSVPPTPPRPARVAPQPSAMPSLQPAQPQLARTGWRWTLPLALAAGLMVLGTALFVLRGVHGDDPAARSLAALPAGPAAPPLTLPAADRVLVRDEQLDRYLRAHRDFGVAQPVSLPLAARRDLEPIAFGR